MSKTFNSSDTLSLTLNISSYGLGLTSHQGLTSFCSGVEKLLQRLFSEMKGCVNR